jgi:formylglycine-generating enzyme
MDEGGGGTLARVGGGGRGRMPRHFWGAWGGAASPWSRPRRLCIMGAREAEMLRDTGAVLLVLLHACALGGCGKHSGLGAGSSTGGSRDASSSGSGGTTALGTGGASGLGGAGLGGASSPGTGGIAADGGGAIGSGGAGGLSSTGDRRDGSAGSLGGERGTGGSDAPGSGGNLGRDASAGAGGATGRGGITDRGVGGIDGPLGGNGGTGGSAVPGFGGAAGRGGSAAGGTAASGGSAGGGALGTGGAGGGCSACQALEQCWNGQLCVAKSVDVPAGFSVDATEVTRGQYAAWLVTSPPVGQQTGACAWNTSFTPDSKCMSDPSVCGGADCAQHPQPCVDLCDGAAYCRAVGKRLCGAVGGGALASGATNDPAQSQWFNVCSSNGVNKFTYGSSLGPNKCNDNMLGGTTTVPVGSKPDCQSTVSGYAGVFDLIGNLAEWEDNCDGSSGASDTCQPRGTAFGSGAALPSCNQSQSTYRSAASPTIGFRCCGP